MNTNTILTKVSKGRDLSLEEFCFLYQQKNNYNEILDCANEINLAKNKNVVTFVHNQNVNYTNICINQCGFCAFRRNTGDEDSYFLSIEEVISKLSETPSISEVCIQGGLSPGLDFSYIKEMLKEIKKNFPHVHIHAFSPMEIYYFSQLSRQGLDNIVESLIDCGLGSIPGTAAEILDDQIRDQICPEKIKTSDWIKLIKIIHNQGLKTTATILFGHIETPLNIARHLHMIREIQYETNGFTELIPLPFIPTNTPIAKTNRCKKMISFNRVSFFYALCRIFFMNSLFNIQASWPKLGLDRAVECTFYGVNDLGGTLYQENITKSAGGIHGEKVYLHQFQRKILSINKNPQLRNTLYEFQDNELLTYLIKQEIG